MPNRLSGPGMNKFLLTAAVVGAFVADAAIAETRFLAALDDMPLAPGLTETPGAAFAFEGREGRILAARASGAADAEAVRAYYDAALPSLGWAKSEGEALSFQRGRERLTVALDAKADGKLDVRFTLVVQPAARAL
jgi:hypothetical protein